MAAIQPHISFGNLTPTAAAGGKARAFARRMTAGWRGQWLLFLAAYLAYSAGRWLFIGDLPTATANAKDIVEFERSLGLFVEGPVQNSLDYGAVVWSLNKIYMLAQMVILPGALVWLYRINRRVYRGLRDTVLATWLLSLPIYALFPVAPPRLAGVGIGDTMAGPVAWRPSSSTRSPPCRASTPASPSPSASRCSSPSGSAAGRRGWRSCGARSSRSPWSRPATTSCSTSPRASS
jgi:PAP2 superfamily